MIKPKTFAGYTSAQFELAKSTLLTLATYLGSFIEDFVVIGGLVPSFIVSTTDHRHVGSADIDLGLSFTILDDQRYASLTEQLKSAGFTPDVTAQGKPAPHRWKHAIGVTVDFLIAPQANAQGEKRVISNELSAVHARALPLAFRDRLKLPVSGTTLANEVATRDVWFAGAGAFVVLKALALRSRGEPKDAYDLLFVLRHFGKDLLSDVVVATKPLMSDDITIEALKVLSEDFASAAHLGPMRAAFEGRDKDEPARQDDVRLVAQFLKLLRG